MENFIFPIRLEKELKNFLDAPEKIPNILCFHGMPAQGKTSFAKYLAEQVSGDYQYFDANSHLREAHDASGIMKDISSSFRKVSLNSFNGDGSKKEFDRCFIIDEWHDFTATRQNSYKVLFDEICDRDTTRNLIIICLNTDEKKTIQKVLTPAIYSRCHLVQFDIFASEKNYIIEKTIEKFPELDPAIIKRSIPDWRVIKRALKML